jgi:uncharacterized membrane protein
MRPRQFIRAWLAMDPIEAQRQAQGWQERIFRVTILILLCLGVVSPVFRHDTSAKVVCGISVVALAILAIARGRRTTSRG